ncbi:MAG: tRNA (adenosine(37)-N6)-threonylcarbamoyltransferase complex ATPase subunit type 1 TsaE [Gammaproteobacteria bacterium]|jgi:tRNA threonylcarbamoyladenosine biosynthesis protein TsaE
MSVEFVRDLPDEAATLAFGGQLARQLTAGCVVYLHGDLGAGKTTLVRGLLQAMGHEGRVKSPTYTLVEDYRVGELSLFHFDLYRLADPEELEYLGMRDYFNDTSIVLIEWPERGGDYLPGADLDIHLAYHEPGRRLRCCANSDKGKTCLAAMR